MDSPDNKAIPSMALVVGILVLASSTSISTTDMYAPSLPDLARWFGTSANTVQLTISLNMLAFGLAQLVHGPLSDRFGRRPVLILSLFAVAVLCIVCALAQSIEQLIVARILLGLAAAAEAVIGLAIIKDLYDEDEQIKALALLGMVIAITPAAAPILGGFLHVAFGWQSNFYVIAALAILSLGIVYQYLPESTRPDTQALKLSRILGGYRGLLMNSDFMLHSAMLGMGLGLIFVFVTGAPFVLISRLGVPVEQFGFYQASIVTAFFFGSVLASKMAGRWPSTHLLKFGVSLIFLGSIILSTIILMDQLTPIRLVLPYMIMTFGMGPLFAVAPSRALRSIKGQSGTASALLSAIEQSLAGLAAVAISLLNDGTARPMAWLTLGLVLALVTALRFSQQARRVMAE